MELTEEVFKDVLLVAAPLVTLWLQQWFESKRQERMLSLEKEKVSVENMRWASAGHLGDITQGIKTLAAQMFELAQSVYDVREAYGFGIHLGVPVSSEEREVRIDQALKIYQISDGKYLEALNTVSVYLTKDEDLRFRDFLSVSRAWVNGIRFSAGGSYMSREVEDFKKVNEILEVLRAELRILFTPKRLLERLSKEG